MAKKGKKAKKNLIKKTADIVKSQAIELNKATIEIADDFVETSIKEGAKWQKVFAKVLKNGTVILGQQQDLVLDTLEELKEQYIESGSRLVELVELDDKNVNKIRKAIKNVLNLDKVIESTTKKVKEAVSGSTKLKKSAKSKVSKAKKTAKKKKIKIDSLMAKATKAKKTAKKKAKTTAKKAGKKVTAKKTAVVKTAKKATTAKVVKPAAAKAVKRVTKPATKKVVAKKATTKRTVKATPTKTVKRVTKTTAKKATPAKTVKRVAKPTAKKTAPKRTVKATPAKAVKRVTKPTAKKVVTRKAAPKKVTSNDLKAIEGIGPKIEGILKKEGINTYKQLSTTKIQDLKNILKAAGPRYSLANPSTWKQQARLAAGEKWNDLIALQATLKGGK